MLYQVRPDDVMVPILIPRAGNAIVTGLDSIWVATGAGLLFGWLVLGGGWAGMQGRTKGPALSRIRRKRTR